MKTCDICGVESEELQYGYYDGQPSNVCIDCASDPTFIKDTYKFDELLIRFEVMYTIKSNRTMFNGFNVIANSIDEALEIAKNKLPELVDKSNYPIITSIEFDDYCSPSGRTLTYHLDIDRWKCDE